jgi:protein-L-isoaspartate(D-aspartate) O-methyltransferase
MIDVPTTRHQMVEQQVRAWSVLDLRVLEVMDRVAREQFVPPAFRDIAYADMGVPLGHGQSMLAPKVEGRILQSLAIQPQDRVLEVGTGSGYFAACPAQLRARCVRSRSCRSLLTPRAESRAQRGAKCNRRARRCDDAGGGSDIRRDRRDRLVALYKPALRGALARRATLRHGRRRPVMDARKVTRTGADWSSRACSRRSTRSSTHLGPGLVFDFATTGEALMTGRLEPGYHPFGR